MVYITLSRVPPGPEVPDSHSRDSPCRSDSGKRGRNPHLPIRLESRGSSGNPRFPIRPGTGVGVPTRIGRKSGNRGLTWPDLSYWTLAVSTQHDPGLDVALSPSKCRFANSRPTSVSPSLKGAGRAPCRVTLINKSASKKDSPPAEPHSGTPAAIFTSKCACGDC